MTNTILTAILLAFILGGMFGPAGFVIGLFFGPAIVAILMLPFWILLLFIGMVIALTGNVIGVLIFIIAVCMA